MAEHEHTDGGTPVSDDRILLPSIADLDAILGEQDAVDALIAEDPESADAHFGKTDLEARAHIPALERLHYERRKLSRALAPLAALFEGGQSAPADARRKQHRAVIGTLIAKEQGLEGDKIESKLERLANQDERHIRFCDELDQLRVRYIRGRIALMEINELIRDREEALRAYSREVAAGIGAQV